MSTNNSKTILFTGHAPVHFVCFRPLYERLTNLPGFEVFVSGGLETKTKTGILHDEQALYRPFGIPKNRILSVEEVGTRDFDVAFSASAHLIKPRNVGTRIQIFHGISFRNKQIREQTMGYDFYFLVGPYMHRRFVEGDLLTENDPRAVKVGFPKTDRLVNGAFDREELLRRYGCDGNRPIILYAPTGERHNSLETMGEEVIKHLSGWGKCDVLIKPHDHPKNTSIDWLSKLAALQNTHTRVVRDLDVIPLLSLADLLITDASSVSNEYSLLDRPIVFLDVPELIQEAIEKGYRLDLDTWGRRGGVVVERPDDVVEAVRGSLNNPVHYSDVRRAMAQNLFYNPGSATGTAMAWLQEHYA